MKLKDTIIFSLAIAFFLIGLHQSMTIGFEYSYWLFMLTFGLLLWYKIRKDKGKENGTAPTKPSAKKGRK